MPRLELAIDANPLISALKEVRLSISFFLSLDSKEKPY